MSKIDFTMQELFASGAHFGHIREKYNPKMQPYIFGLREGIYLIDLEKTVVALSSALSFIAEQKKQGKNILFVCTKDGINDVVRKCAIEAGMPYVTYRWPGGMLTNFATLKKQIDKLNKLEAKVEVGGDEKISKKDKGKMVKEINKLNQSFEGVKKLTKTPDSIFIVDTIREKTALAEAKHLKIPIVAVVDSNGDPTGITYPIPANDDAITGIELMFGEIKKALV